MGGSAAPAAEAVGNVAPALKSTDFLDVSKLAALPPDLSNSLKPVDQLQKVGGGAGQMAGKEAKGIASGFLSGLGSDSQQPQQTPAGPQLGAGVAQAPQMGDAYAEYIKKLQQQNQAPFYGN